VSSSQSCWTMLNSARPTATPAERDSCPERQKSSTAENGGNPAQQRQTNSRTAETDEIQHGRETLNPASEDRGNPVQQGTDESSKAENRRIQHSREQRKSSTVETDEIQQPPNPQQDCHFNAPSLQRRQTMVHTTVRRIKQ